MIIEVTTSVAIQTLDHCATDSNPVLWIKGCLMILRIYSIVIYLSESKTRSITGGYFLLSDPDPPVTNNESVPTTLLLPPVIGSGPLFCKIIKHILAEAIKAKIATIYGNCKKWFSYFRS